MTTLAYVFVIILGVIVLGGFGTMFYIGIKFDNEEKKAEKLREAMKGS